MNWLFWVIFGIVFIITMIAVLSDAFYEYDSVGDYILWSIPSSLVGGMVIAFFYLFSCPSHSDYFKPVEKHTVELVQSQVNHKIDGYMGIFCGRIKDRDVYRFYRKDGANGFKMDYFFADVSRIEIIDSTQVPHAVYYDTIIYTNEPNWWQRNFFTKTGWEREVTHEAKHMGVLCVPKDAIIENKFDGMNL